MSETKRPDKKQSDEKKPGKFHYNPGNMAGQEAGVVKELNEQKKNSTDRHDAEPRKREDRTDKHSKG